MPKTAGLAAILLFAFSTTSVSFAAEVSRAEVTDTYVRIGQAVFEDALSTAKSLRDAILALEADPTQANLEAARAAWIAARVPYQQSEAFRFGNPLVDAWEGKVNAWPLDEGLLDYVDASYGAENDYNSLYAANVIANPTIVIDGMEVTISQFTPAIIADVLQEAGHVEANVASGYHAIEFMLWGQDLHGTGPGAGERPASDFDVNNCTNGNCDRRIGYLNAATDLLVSDLEEMVANWVPGGAARSPLVADPKRAIAAMLTGMGSLSYGELAGERMKLGLLLHDPEEEQDCFSDNTYASHFDDVRGIMNVYFGHYVRADGSVVEGPSLSDLVAQTDAALNDEMTQKLQSTHAKAEIMVERGHNIEAYDQMIAEGNAEGNEVVQAVIDSLIDQTASIERVVSSLGIDQIEIEVSDSLESADAVFQ
ncbi:MAG: peptidase [Hyphomicrobiaceae bacterium]|nr:peptidase [Hyphomicrobiaceae bacterium]MCC0022954.1 peptidase [Hyphomicrobiaceae bacterium]